MRLSRALDLGDGMSNQYVWVGLNNALNSQVRDIKKALKEGDLAKATKKVNELERVLKDLTVHL